MTIVFGKTVLLTKEPTDDDMILLARIQQAREKWIAEGRPASNQGFW